MLATVASESTDKLLAELRGLSFFDEEKVGEELLLLSVYPTPLAARPDVAIVASARP